MTPRPQQRRPPAARQTALALALLLPTLGASACGDLAPEVGPLHEIPCVDADSDPERSLAYDADLRLPLFARSPGGCLACHDPGAASPLGVTVGGLDLSTYAGLRRGGATAGADVVVPGQPCTSALVRKLGPAPPFGSRMPLNGPPFFSPAEMQRVTDWVAEGAHER